MGILGTLSQTKECLQSNKFGKHLGELNFRILVLDKKVKIKEFIKFIASENHLFVRRSKLPFYRSLVRIML
jgi:hypothetical protein